MVPFLSTGPDCLRPDPGTSVLVSSVKVTRSSARIRVVVHSSSGSARFFGRIGVDFRINKARHKSVADCWHCASPDWVLPSCWALFNRKAAVAAVSWQIESEAARVGRTIVFAGHAARSIKGVPSRNSDFKYLWSICIVCDPLLKMYAAFERTFTGKFS